MNSYARRYVSDDPTLKTWVGWRRPRDRLLVYFSVALALSAYIGVYISEEKEKNRRHKSIAKDIEREEWRARELGLTRPVDDGFAERYMTHVKK